MSLKLHAFLSANYCQIYSPLVWNCCFDDCHVYIQPPWNVQRQLQPPWNATTYHSSSRDWKGAEKIGRFQVILTLPHISTKQLSRGSRSQKHAWLINLCAIGAPSTGAVIVTNQDLEHKQQYWVQHLSSFECSLAQKITARWTENKYFNFWIITRRNLALWSRRRNNNRLVSGSNFFMMIKK